MCTLLAMGRVFCEQFRENVWHQRTSEFVINRFVKKYSNHLPKMWWIPLWPVCALMSCVDCQGWSLGQRIRDHAEWGHQKVCSSWSWWTWLCRECMFLNSFVPLQNLKCRSFLRRYNRLHFTSAPKERIRFISNKSSSSCKMSVWAL